MVDLIDKIFECQSIIRNKVINDNEIIDIAKKVYFISFISIVLYALFIVNLEINDFIKNILFLTISIVNLISGFLSSLKEMCISISGFMKTALITTIIIGIFSYFGLSKYVKDSYWMYAIIIIIFTIIWSFLSTLSNPKIGKISNAIISVVLVIAIQANSFIWSIFELDKIKLGHDLSYIGLNFSEYELMEISINTLLFPFFVMVTIGALACAYKEYWLENNSK